MWIAARIAWVVLTLAGCESGHEPPSRYKAEIDLAATIAQLGAQEQADVDEAQERLVGLGNAAVPALEAAVAHEATPVRLAAIETLGQIDSPQADAVLVAVATREPDAEVRATALLKLGEAGRSAGRPVLEAALRDPSETVSHTAALACSALCTSPDAIDRIVDLGLHGVPNVELGRLRTTLIAIMKGSDATAATHARTAIAQRTAPILAGTGPLDDRVRAALLAADAGASEVEPVLLEAAAESPSLDVRLAAIQWLGRSGSAAAVPVLVATLRDGHLAAAAGMALQALAGRGVPEARTALAELPKLVGGPPAPPAGS